MWNYLVGSYAFWTTFWYPLQYENSNWDISSVIPFYILPNDYSPTGAWESSIEYWDPIVVNNVTYSYNTTSGSTAYSTGGYINQVRKDTEYIDDDL